MNSPRHQSIRAWHAKLPINTTFGQNAILSPHSCEIWGGGGIKAHSSVRLLVCLSVPLSVTKTLTWLISSEVLFRYNIDVWHE